MEQREQATHYHNGNNADCLVGDTVYFPDPVIDRCQRRKDKVIIDNEKPPEIKVILQSGENNYYEIGRHLRDTIYGYVYHAFELRLREDGVFIRTIPKRQVALKVYNKEKILQMRGKSQENPILEFSAMQYIGHHPHIMSLLQCCEDIQSYYLIMDFIDGGELLDLILEQPLPENIAKIYLKQILDGLNYLHNHGVAHRDMSLENVLFSQNGYTCKIIDFGMTIRIPYNEETRTFMRIPPKICGKKNYMAPEVVENARPYNPQLCDIWAIGVMLFIMITGCPPIDIAAPLDNRYLMLITGKLPMMLERWGLQVSPAALDLIQLILRPNPDDRPSIQQIADHPWFRVT